VVGGELKIEESLLPIFLQFLLDTLGSLRVGLSSLSGCVISIISRLAGCELVARVVLPKWQHEFWPAFM